MYLEVVRDQLSRSTEHLNKLLGDKLVPVEALLLYIV